MNVSTESAEDRLRKSEERYRSLIEASSAMVWTTDAEGKCVEPQAGWEQFTGQTFPDQAVLGGMVCIHPDDRAGVLAAWTNSAAARAVFRADFRLWHAESKSWRYVTSRGAPVRNADGSIREWVGTITDVHERREAIERLRESEERFRTMADTAPVLIWVSGTDRLRTWFNKPWLDFRGRTVEEECGDGWADGVHPEDVARLLEIYASSFEARRSFQMEYRLRRRDGGYHWIVDSGVPRFSPSGEFLGFIGSCIDIDGRKRAEEALRANETRLKLALEAGRMGTWDRDIGSGLLTWSPEQFRLFGLEPGSIVPTYARWLERVHPDDRKPAEAYLVEVMRERGAYVHEYRTIWPDGTVHWLQSRGQFYYDGDTPVRVSGVLIDITDQKRAEQDLRETTQVLETIIDACPLAVMLLDEDGMVRLWNAAAERIFGWKAADVIGKFSPAVGEQYADQFRRNLREMKAGRQLAGHETQRLTSSGAQLDVAVWTANAAMHGKLQYLAIVADITARKRLEQQLRHAQKLESLGVLAGGIAHDFNNLLTGILGSVSLASDLLPPDHGAQRLFTHAILACERASTLTNQLLAYAGKGRFVIEFIRFDHLVRQIAELIKASLPKHVAVNFQSSASLPAVEGDSSQLQQVVFNLILNAAEAVPEGQEGVVRVETSARSLTREDCLREFGVELDPGTYLQVEVIDNGTGMTEETKARIFDPFFTTRFTGRGLGLAAVQGIVRGHKGGLRVVSAPGEGTRFTVVFPASTAHSPAPREIGKQRSVEAYGLSGTILVVDDEETVRSTARRVLQRIGYNVIEASNGKEALHLFRSEPEVHAVLLDLTMPVMDGITTLERLCEINSGVRVVLCSGYNESEVRQRVTGRISGQRIRAFLQKPYTSDALGRTITEALAEE